MFPLCEEMNKKQFDETGMSVLLCQNVIPINLQFTNEMRREGAMKSSAWNKMEFDGRSLRVQYVSPVHAGIIRDSAAVQGSGQLFLIDCI